MAVTMAGGERSLDGEGETAVDEPLPLSRRRRGTQRIAILSILAAGFAMLVVALLSSAAEAASVGLTAALGTVVVGFGSAAVAEVATMRRLGVVTTIAGLACVVSAFVPDLFAGPELARLLCGIVTVAASVVLLPRAPTAAPGIRL